MKSTTSPANVLHVVDSLEFGGLERIVTDLAIAQHDAGSHVAVFSINATTGFAPTLEAANIPVYRGDKRATADFRTLTSLRNLARQHPFDIVHAHNFVPNYYSAAALLGLRNSPTQVTTCHDMGTRLDNRKLRWLYRLSLLRTAGVAMVGQQVFQRFVEGGIVPSRLATLVLNGIPVDRFTVNEMRRSEARKRLGLDAQVPVIGCVGRLVGLKNHRLMIEILPTIARSHPDVRLVVVGGGVLEADLREQIRKSPLSAQIILTGERTDVSDLLPAFDVYALPSLTEGLSVSLLEACASSLAVVASAVGGNPEIVRDAETGLLVPVNHGAALTQALITLLGDSQLRARLGRAAREWVERHASVQAVRTGYEDFYRQALERRRG